MASQNKITISFSKEYNDVYKYLKTHGNTSRIVCEAVRKFMYEDSIESKVERIVYRLLEGKKTEMNIEDNDLKNSVDGFDF